MIPELGVVSLILALILAVVQGTVPFVGVAKGDARLMRLARSTAAGQFVFVALAFALLLSLFIANDFTVLNVASNSNSQLPLHYRISASWGSHEGSMLLWMLMLSGWGVAVAAFSRHLPQDMVARVLAVMGLVATGFLLFLLLTSNPFGRLLPAADEGRDLNPLLQDAGMIFHPPLLYMGYVGFSVAFAFAVAALLSGRLDAEWARWTRPWTTVAWCFLTLGICLGSFWAYYELGWGGWWFWDPVENASFMPWLVGTALVHSLAVSEKRGTFKAWTVLLAILAFSLSLLGTFLVRSGVLTSVHAFASDPARGVFILAFLATVIGISLALFAWRAPSVGLGAPFGPVSRESMLLANNVLLVVAMAAVLLGTLYPLVLDALGMGKISVGPPYFDAVFYPLMIPALVLLGAGPVTRWGKASLGEIAGRLKWALVVALAGAAVVPWLAGKWTPLIALGLLLAFWIAATVAAGLWRRLREAAQPGLVGKLRSNSASYYGMQLAHLGVAAFIIGVTMVKGYETEKDVRMEPGDTVEIGGYVLAFKGIDEVPGPNYQAMRGRFEISREGKVLRDMRPEKRVYRATGQPMTEAALDRSLTRDLYVSLGEPVGGRGAWAVRVYHKPFVNWIWLGCVLMALGGFVAVADKRYRVRRTAQAEAGAGSEVEAGAAGKAGGKGPRKGPAGGKPGAAGAGAGD